MTKGKSCCEDQESDVPEENDGCCKDETLVLQSAKDVLVKKDERVVKQSLILLYAILPDFNKHALLPGHVGKNLLITNPSLLSQQKLISTFVLRI
ncbi:MAG: hypothetical protein JNK73_03070 [Bacteroidia bacterium]|nr:hypothetical protein [Bacteroidia bacterium]